jgi:MoaA/NifB/PqqE/SkfB family radical SAM enzyme
LPLISKAKYVYRILYAVFVADNNGTWHWIKQGRLRKARSYVWSRLFVRDVQGGLLDPFWKRFPHLKGTPKEVEVEITTRCGLRCVMCEHTHWEDKGYAKQDIKFDDYKRICEGFGSLRYVGIQGMGTPFLNPDFARIVEYSFNQGHFLNIVESFTSVKPEQLELMVSCVDRLDLSLDAATKDLYESIRPGAKFENLAANLQNLRKLKVERGSPFPQVFVRIVAFEKNKNEIPKIVAWLKELDLNLGHPMHVEIAGLLVFRKIKNLLIDHDVKIAETIVAAAEKIAHGTNIHLSWNRTAAGCAPMDNCTKWLQPFIMGNGDAVMDCSVMMSDNRKWLHANTVGNAIRTPYREIWKKEEYARARAAVNNPGSPISKWCQDCRAVDTKTRQTAYGVLDETIGTEVSNELVQLFAELQTAELHTEESKDEANSVATR